MNTDNTLTCNRHGKEQCEECRERGYRALKNPPVIDGLHQDATSSTQRFIEDAIAGGWHHSTAPSLHTSDHYFGTLFQPLLDPLAWQAVGKTRGWNRRTFRQSTPRCIRMTTKPTPNRWKKEWHTFIDHLADAKTIEEALTAIE